jgi:type IV pilus assembly protein PilA
MKKWGQPLILRQGMRRVRKGFTLIELMIIVAIIGILAAVALPSYQDYTIRAQMSEAILAASPCRTAITEGYQVGGTPPLSNGWGCENTTGDASNYVDTVTTDANGVITVKVDLGSASTTKKKKKKSKVDGSVVTLVPLIDGTPAKMPGDNGNAVNGWRCGSASDGTTLLAKFLPSTCRGV